MIDDLKNTKCDKCGKMVEKYYPFGLKKYCKKCWEAQNGICQSSKK